MAEQRRRAVVQAELVPDGAQCPGRRVTVRGAGLEHGQRGVGARQPRKQADGGEQGGREHGPPQQGRTTAARESAQDGEDLGQG
ncbi:hypothetical protein GCM10010384_08240 [Streptomyces djakartensis]|uniref:Uncharacterized protein n=1 Tax=Streptomyces djakartensis TaxID=68193 RepID=A0ABQ2Z6S4_9ACTN|nr:hypothetical protein GCM10010384_08240 [Streptomyces djakartensis]